MKGIVITTSEYTKEWLEECLESLKNAPYRVLIVRNGYDGGRNGFELAGIEEAANHFDEFVYLHDTTVVKDITLFDKLFAIPGTVALTDKFFHYFGKYVSADLPPIPQIDDKASAISLETTWFNKPYTVFSPEFPHTSDVFIEKHGRKNMVLENDYLIKYKGNWGA